MKVLFISDIHGIINNLEHIENVIETKEIDKLICLGDLYYHLSNNNKNNVVNTNYVKHFLKKYSNILICMKGNCDSIFDINNSDFIIYDDIKKIKIENNDFYLTHGNKYNYENFNENGILIYGHEHIPYIKTKNNTIYVNVGSISLPKMNNNPTYAIYENNIITIFDIYENIIDKIKIKEGII